MTGDRNTTLVLAAVLVVAALTPALTGIAGATSSGSNSPTNVDGEHVAAGDGWTSPFGNSSNETDDGWTWPWAHSGSDGDAENASEPAPSGPPQTEFNASLLRQQGVQVGDRPSIRRFGDGSLWLRHVPTGPLAVDDPANYSRYVKPYSIVTRDHVYLGGFLGWSAPDVEATVHVVTWRPKTVTYRATENNRTVVRQKTVPANVTHQRQDVTLPGGRYFRKEIAIPKHYGETRYVAIWIENARWDTQWAFRTQVNPATATVPQTSVGARITWAGLHIGGTTLVTALVVLFLGKKLLDKIGAVIIHPAELFFAVFAPSVPFLLLFWNSIISALAQRPELVGIALGTVIGLAGIWIIRERPDEWLFLQPTTEAEIGEDGAGSWKWANRAHHVIERGRDGRLAVPREGWLAAIARAYPFYDATPLLEFDAHAIEDHLVDEVPDDIDLPDDASVLDNLRTRFVGDGDQDEYDEIVLIHPGAEDVVEHTDEALEIGLPTLVEWPATDEGVWIGSVPVPSIRFGLLLFGVAFVTVAASLATWVTTSVLWGLIAACAAVGLLVVHPTEGTKARVALAPAPFDSVIANMIRTFEGFNDHADSQYWRDRALESEADRRLDRTAAREETEMTKLRRLGQRLAPEPGDDPAARERERDTARNRYKIGEPEPDREGGDDGE